MNLLPVLISYAYERCFDWEKIRQISHKIDLLIDCGAFTVHKKGKVIRLTDYLNFLYKIDYPVDGYFVLDSIGDPKKTFENFLEMRKEGFDPMPIFTRGDSLERLENYYGYSDIVALGGLKAGGENDNGYVKWFMEKGVRGRKTHWLGFAQHDLIYHYKPYSVDAINWKRALLYGDLVIYTGMGFKHAKRTDFSKRLLPREIITAIRNLGYDPFRLKKEESWRGVQTYAHEISTASFFNYISDIKRDTGTKFYFVCNAQHELDFLLSMA
jgi:hypothetical protein